MRALLLQINAFFMEICMAKTGRPSRPPGVCVFCGGSGLSKEHIFSDWMKEILPASADHSQFVIHQHTDPLTGMVIVQPFLPERRQGSMAQRKIRKVCRRCNGGWMSKVVQDARPFARAMILDESIELDARAQIVVATWIALATTMAEFTDPSTAGIPASDRAVLMSTKAPPLSWTVYVGRYEGTEFKGTRYRHHGMGLGFKPRTRGHSTAPVSAQFTTYVLGALLVHALSCTDEALAAELRRAVTPAGMIRLWPNAGRIVCWPSTKLLDDTETLAIADAGRDYIRRSSRSSP